MCSHNKFPQIFFTFGGALPTLLRHRIIKRQLSERASTYYSLSDYLPSTPRCPYATYNLHLWPRPRPLSSRASTFFRRILFSSCYSTFHGPQRAVLAEYTRVEPPCNSHATVSVIAFYSFHPSCCCPEIPPYRLSYPHLCSLSCYRPLVHPMPAGDDVPAVCFWVRRTSSRMHTHGLLLALSQYCTPNSRYSSMIILLLLRERFPQHCQDTDTATSSILLVMAPAEFVPYVLLYVSGRDFEAFLHARFSLSSLHYLTTT